MQDSPDQPRPRWFLREWRKAKGLKQHHLAESIGTTVSVISELESGKKRMNDDWIVGWSSALSISPVDLLRSPDDQALEASEDGRYLASYFFLCRTQSVRKP